MNSYIDSAIAEAVATPVAQPEEVVANNATENQEADAVEQGEKEEVVFPKKAVNAITRRDRQIGKLRAEAESLKAELAKYQQPAPQTKADDGKPKESDYETYADYLEALGDWKVDSKLSKTLAERETKEKQARVDSELTAWRAEREANMATQAQELIKSNPEYHTVLAEHADIIESLPAEIQDVFLDADNAPLAVFNLAKEGKLEALASMSPIRAAMEISRASAQAVTKPQSKAPAPFSTPRGVAASGKDPLKMTPDDLLKSIRKG